MQNCEVQILVGGKPIKQFVKEGVTWVEARKGVSYEIKLKNNTRERVLAIVSVDGIDVLSGSPANPDSSGYIVEPYSSVTVKGFRTSQEEVNRFEFSEKEDSYAVTSPDGEQSPANCGGIGVRFIAEKQKPTLYNFPKKNNFNRAIPLSRYETSLDKSYENHEAVSFWMDNPSNGETPRGMMRSMSFDTNDSVSRRITVPSSTPSMLNYVETATPDMGTKFSEEVVKDAVTYVTFERGEEIRATTVYYGSRRFLESIGIEFEPKLKVNLPQMFKPKFCQPPVKRVN